MTKSLMQFVCSFLPFPLLFLPKVHIFSKFWSLDKSPEALFSAAATYY